MSVAPRTWEMPSRGLICAPVCVGSVAIDGLRQYESPPDEG
jgi:hypothetical protein